MSKATIVQQRSVEREYGYQGIEAIIDHKTHGRLFICDGFGGIDYLRGGAVRFYHGIVCKLHAEDDFESIDADWNEFVTVRTAIVNMYDDSRPVLDWSGRAVAGLAKSCGLT